MLRAIVILVFGFGLLVGSVLSRDFAELMGLAGIAGSCMALEWLIRERRDD
jgi:hypothetical protein